MADARRTPTPRHCSRNAAMEASKQARTTCSATHTTKSNSAFASRWTPTICPTSHGMTVRTANGCTTVRNQPTIMMPTRTKHGTAHTAMSASTAETNAGAATPAHNAAGTCARRAPSDAPRAAASSAAMTRVRPRTANGSASNATASTIPRKSRLLDALENYQGTIRSEKAENERRIILGFIDSL